MVDVVIQTPSPLDLVIQQPQPVGIDLLMGQGPAGPKGDKGDAGPPGSYFEHQQMTPLATWTINHNLGFRPNVALLTLGGASMVAEIIHTSTNQALAYFDGPVPGLAICS